MPSISKKSPTPVEVAEGVTSSSYGGNIFADMGLPNPELRLLKAKLTLRLQQAITERKLTSPKAAKLLGIPSAALKSLLCGSTCDFTIDRLLQFLATVGQKCEIVVRASGETTTHSGRGTPSPAAGPR